MNQNYTDLYNQYDNTSEAALQKCIDYANKEILAGTTSPAHVMYVAFEVYKRARLLEDKMRDISKEIYHQRLPKKMSYDFFQFIRLLDPKVKEICDEEYKNRSPYGPVVPKEW